MSRVAVLGAGVIGKRVATALAADPQLELAGVLVRSAGTAVQARPDLPWWATDDAAAGRLRAGGTEPRGTGAADLLAGCDAVIDCGPSRTGVGRAAAYREAGVPAVFCGGERSAELGRLVHPQLTPHRIRPGLPSCRLASCNTTALARLVAAVGATRLAGLDAVVLRCGTDRDKAVKGVPAATVVAPRPSHHAEDLTALVPELVAGSVAATVPSVAGHVISVRLRGRDRGVAGPPGAERLADLTLRLAAAGPRVVLRRGEDPLDTGRLRAEPPQADRRWQDRYELLALPVPRQPGQLWLSLDNEAVTIPETLDVLRLVTGTAPDPRAAAAVTDRALGLAGTAAPVPAGVA